MAVMALLLLQTEPAYLQDQIPMDFKKTPKTNFKDVGELSEQEAAEEARALREGIHYHDWLYYVKNESKISDSVYDKLFHRLEELEAANPQLKTADSPTVRIGAEPVSQLRKIKHKAPLLSLKATLDKRDVESFVASVDRKAETEAFHFCLEPKFDGLSVEIVYAHGHFEYGTTRGNGQTGEDISHNLKTIHALPLTLQHEDDIPESLAVRAEVYMPKKGFVDLNKRRVEHGEEPFSNPRNATAGLMRQYQSRRSADIPLDLFFYEILALDGDSPSTHHEVLEKFSYWGFKTCHLNGSTSSLKQIEHYHHKLAERRDVLDYEIDGIVIKLDEHALRDKLGVRERSPRWALAWKFEPRAETTVVDDIVVQVGRTGILTPVALLEPVDVSGVTVSRATLHNAHEVHRKDIRVGDRVRIIRAGDVIPEVEQRVKQSGKKRHKPFGMPERCPVCDARVVREGAYHICVAGLSCAAQLTGRIHHYAAREAMDIERLGRKTAAQLVRRGLVRDLADLYSLDVEDLHSLEGLAARSAKRLHDAISDARNPRLDRFLFALGIHQVGRRVARLLADEFGALDKLAEAGKEQIERIDGIGSEIATATAHFFADESNRDVLRRMRDRGLEVGAMTQRQRQPLQNQTFVFTGSLADLTRDEAKDQVEALGGRATSSVSSETDYLVVGSNPGSKLGEAEALGVRRIDEDEFLKIVEHA